MTEGACVSATCEICGQSPSVEIGAGDKAETGFDTGPDTGSNMGSDVGSDAGSDAGSYVGSDAGSEAGSDIGSDTGCDTGSDTWSNTNSEAHSGENSDADFSANCGAGSDAGVDEDSDTASALLRRARRTFGTAVSDASARSGNASSTEVLGCFDGVRGLRFGLAMTRSTIASAVDSVWDMKAFNEAWLQDGNNDILAHTSRQTLLQFHFASLQLCIDAL